MATIIPPNQPTPQDNPATNAGPGNPLAADLIREKVARLYSEEPDAITEAAEADASSHRSKHQEFMYRLSTSGKDLATVQTEWHEYYQSLKPEEQHQVWQEFYDSQSAAIKPTPAVKEQPRIIPQRFSEHKHEVVRTTARAKKTAARPKTPKLRDVRSAEEIQSVIIDKVSAGGQLKLRHHLQSLLFGLGMGSLVVVIFLFSFFNEIIIAPFVQPSRTATSTPLIVSGDSVPPTPDPEVIIPKINVEIPVNYNETSTDESTIENDLQSGIVHYPTTSLPGQAGNTAFFGHSSNNIFNKGKYKFAFVLLHTLVPGDTFYLSYNDKIFAYKVISKNVVPPSDVSVLNPVAGQTATATLITCDPPGTSLNRLVVVGQQISPDPSTNSSSNVATTASSTSSTSSTPSALPGNGPTLWSKVTGSIAGKTATGAVMIIAAMLILYRSIKLWKRR